MFAKCDFKILELKDGNKFLGIVKTNDDILIKKYNHPFIRNKIATEIIRLGKRDYEKSDQQITSSLNDYYKRTSESKDNERKVMITNYNRLYEYWNKLREAKQLQDIKIMEEMYDKISYELSLLGYKMSNN